MMIEAAQYARGTSRPQAGRNGYPGGEPVTQSDAGVVSGANLFVLITKEGAFLHRETGYCRSYLNSFRANIIWCL
jgi:hypothetical protein